MNLWQSIAHTRTLSRWCDKIIYSQHLIRSYDVMHATILTVLTFCVGIGIYLKFRANKSPRDSIACHTNTRLLVRWFVRSLAKWIAHFVFATVYRFTAVPFSSHIHFEWLNWTIKLYDNGPKFRYPSFWWYFNVGIEFRSVYNDLGFSLADKQRKNTNPTKCCVRAMWARLWFLNNCLSINLMRNNYTYGTFTYGEKKIALKNLWPVVIDHSKSSKCECSFQTVHFVFFYFLQIFNNIFSFDGILMLLASFVGNFVQWMTVRPV